MSTGMRIFLIIGSVLSCIYVLRGIKKSRMKTENSLFWIFFSVILVILGLFPGIADWFAGMLGVQSTVNLVYLIIIFLLVIKVFLQDQKTAKERRLQSGADQEFCGHQRRGPGRARKPWNR